jgi:hypothetical protein
MKTKVLENNYFFMMKALASIKSEDLPITSFEVLEKYKKKLNKYSIETNRDFPELEPYNTILAKDAYHFANNEELLSIFIFVLQDSDSKLVKIVVGYSKAGDKSTMSFNLQEFDLEIPAE